MSNNPNNPRCSTRPKRQDASGRGSRGNFSANRTRSSRLNMSGATFTIPGCNSCIPQDMQGSIINASFLPGRAPSNLNWTSNDLGISSLMQMSRNAQQSKRKVQEVKPPPPEDTADPRFLIKNLPMDTENEDPEVNKKQKETIMEWFDRNVEKELQKRHESVADAGNNPEDMKVPKKGLPVTDEYMSRMAESGASGIEVETKFRMEKDSEMAAAVDKLAMAEAMISFAGAVKAAEAAVEMAPPEKAEEAAVEGVKLFHQANTHVNAAKENMKGIKPVEIIGYIGVTKPKDI
ncbi:unnamed protein product [Brassicogethes aeneus]|uniref:Uncharacterized protein n=1 Tax=Brassicogethes aeneus TaxID=1431903 RepID=A0A9P0BAL3_BRAAE|nr:unnamed protein product [Brassicogethes aeneus]